MATTMDLADKIQLDQVISFPHTNTTWNIIDRLSPWPKPTVANNYLPTSDSFVHSYVFRVELVGSSAKVVPDYIPKFAIVKIKCSSAIPKDAIDVDMLNEIRALEQLTLNRSQHTPRILDAKVQHHLTSMRRYEPPEGTQEERKHYVTYVLMTEIEGLCLKGDVFWKLDQGQRRLIRLAFRIALTDVQRCWVILTKPDPKHLIWNRAKQMVYILNFEKSITFNNLALMHDTEEGHISRTLPTRFQAWSNAWYVDYGLAESSVDLFTKGTDSTAFDEQWLAKYGETVMQEPKMPIKDVAAFLVGARGAGIETHPEKRSYAGQLASFQQTQNRRNCGVM
ncbi:uncharacterized protein PV09_04769 [Verruconis gallopava]|uniref:Uncharacterized protein n=1 Tax=Verruconis gallopava TaxID=253628 RepID=A0A0D2AXN0_9PEZI|nr:uncharacterized protein PV09_04769 [Verruconis gallopava]KIW03929.1 hypothetical protein PV09_04769 [Verruconis gallopava]